MKVAIHSYFEDGELVKNDLYNKVVIHVIQTSFVILTGRCRSICISLS